LILECKENAMPADPNSLVTPAVLPKDSDLHQDDIPAEADNLEAGENDPTEDDMIASPETVVGQLPVGGARDEPDVGRLINSYSPNAR
jgi:hypothetical protein